MVGSSAQRTLGLVGVLALGSLLGCARATEPLDGASDLADAIGVVAPRAHAAPPIEAATDTEPQPVDAPDAPAVTLKGYPPGTIASLAYRSVVDMEHTPVVFNRPHAQNGDAPLATLQVRSVPGQTASLAFDQERRLYQLDYSGRIQVFRSGATGFEAPERVINPDGLAIVKAGADTYAQAIGVDSKGHIYITIATGLAATGPEMVWTYASDAAGDATPERVISGPKTGLELPSYLGFDSHDRLYVGDYLAMAVYVFDEAADGDVAPRRTVRDFDGVEGMAVAPDGTIYIAPEGVPEWSIKVYAPAVGDSQPLLGRIEGEHTGLDPASAAPINLAVDPWGGIAVVSTSSGLQFAGARVGDIAPEGQFVGSYVVAVAPRHGD